jgi:hypothetical protein
MDTAKKPLRDEEKKEILKQREAEGHMYLNKKYNGGRFGIGVGKPYAPANQPYIIKRKSEIDYAKLNHTPDLKRLVEHFPDGTSADTECIVYCNPEVCEHRDSPVCKGIFGHPCRLKATSRFGSKTNYTQSLIDTLPAYAVIFDLRWYKGECLEKLPLSQRLPKLQEFGDYLKDQGATNFEIAEYYEKDFVEVFMNEPEGIVLKRKDSLYVEMNEDGPRPPLWIKGKKICFEIVDVVGYGTDASGKISHTGLRNLIITQDGKYRGKVGGGFENNEREEAKRFLDRFPQKAAPYEIYRQDLGTYKYIPDSGLKAEVVFEVTMPSGIFYCPRMTKLFYPQTVAAANEAKPQQVFWQFP